MSQPRAKQRHLQNLQSWRNPSEPDTSTEFITRFFETSIQKPHKQLAAVIPVWRKLIPGHILDRCALISLTRGTLTVQVADSAARFELDRLFRSGLERQIKQSCRSPIRRIRFKVAPLAGEAPQVDVAKGDVGQHARVK